MKILKIIAVDHSLQWRDTKEGHLAAFLSKILADTQTIDLIAEEADRLPSTVAQRLACRANVPWQNVDMDTAERLRVGIHDELTCRTDAPLIDGGYKEYYLPNADKIRERYWLSSVNKWQVERVVLLCGLLHLGTVATKFRLDGWQVEENDLCKCRWYVERFGTCTVVEEDGTRWCERRPNSISL